MWPFDTAYPEHRPEDVDGAEFDYIVVGGGAAGSVVASRLSEDPTVSVLLLERGRAMDSIFSRIPLLSQQQQGAWLQCVVNRASPPMQAVLGRRVHLHGSEGLGGNTRVNAMLVTRGPPASQDEWAEELGLDEWSWDKVEPYYVKMENCRAHPGKPYHGYDGPLEHRQNPMLFSWYPFMETAARNMGLSVRDDLNNPDAPAQGYFKLDNAIGSDGYRVSSFRAYLSKKTALQRQQHLTVCTGAMALKVEVDPNSKQVTGVHFESADAKIKKRCFARARREVILCNGALRTPQLLLLSGIGPKKDIEAKGVTSVHDLPTVGAGFKDHFALPIMVEMPWKDTIHHVITVLGGLWHLILFFLFRRGIFASGSTQASIFIKTAAIDKKAMRVEARDMQGRDTMDARSIRNIPDAEIMINPIDSLGVYGEDAANPFLSLFVALTQPVSEGRIELASADPHAHPLVHHPLFADKRDLVSVRPAVRFAMRMMEEFRHAGYGKRHPAPLLFAPGIKIPELERFLRSRGDMEPAENDADSTSEKAALLTTPAKRKPAIRPDELDLEPIPEGSWRDVPDAVIDDYVLHTARSALHFACSARMSLTAETGVVDQRLRVHGLRGLRIADASVFPKIPAAHTMLPVMMVGERCADFIKEEWREKL